MSDATDRALIEEYARTGSEEAFRELAHRHVDLVYSTALRVLRNASLAEDVTQRVFVALARNAIKLRSRAVVAGWLHETTRNFAVTTIRSEERRRQREQAAAAMENVESKDSQATWDRMVPHLDGALAQLSEADRDAILLRYFERKTAREIGERLGLTEEAAQKRAARALDRLRTIFAERGLVAPVAGVANLLSVQAVQSAPVGLTASVIAAAGAAGAAEAATSVSSTIGFIMASTKLKLGLAAALVAGVSTPLVIQHQANVRLRNEVAALQQRSAELERSLEESQRAAANNIDPQEPESRRQERTELLRLRGEVGSLRAQVSDLTRARDKAATPRVAASRMPDDPRVPAESWANVGLATPIAAFQTMKWARANRDTNLVANSLAWADEHTRSRIEEIFAAAPEDVRSRYGSADAYILSLFDHPTPDDSRRVVGYRILGENIAEDSASLLVEEQFADGHIQTGRTEYVRIGNEWRQALDFDRSGTDKLSAVLQTEGNAQPQPPEKP